MNPPDQEDVRTAVAGLLVGVLILALFIAIGLAAGARLGYYGLAHPGFYN